MKRFVTFFVAILVLGTNFARAEDPADAYVEVYSLIQLADSLNANGKSQEALAKYRQAQVALASFRKNHPEFQPRTAEYRANYLSQKIQQLSKPNAAAPAATAQAGTNNSGRAPGSGQAAAPTSSAVSVQLVSPGNEPRAPLRLHPKEGDKQITTVTINTKTEMSMGGNKMPEMPSPTIVITSEATVKSVSADADTSYEIVTTDAPAMPQLKGLSVSGVLTSRAINKGATVKTPSGLNAQTRQIADQIKEGYMTAALPLPEEPIGPGAKWEVKMPVKSGGISMTQTFNCELASLERDKAIIKVNSSQSAPNQKVENPAMPNFKMDLTGFSGTGSGETIVDLGKLLPVQSTTDGQLEMTMSAGAGAQKQEINIKVALNITTDSK